MCFVLGSGTLPGAWPLAIGGVVSGLEGRDLEPSARDREPSGLLPVGGGEDLVPPGSGNAS